MTPAANGLLDNQSYYFEVGHGEWRGSFSFRITSREKFRQASLGLKNRLLLLGMRAVYRLFGQSRIDSKLWADPDRGVAGVAGNTVRISKLGLTLYLLEETYTLAVNGSDVDVHAHERFGPIPSLLTNEKRHPAVIHEDARSSTYYIPLLGADWVASYTVHPDRTHIDGHLTCAFAEAWEIIAKLGVA